MMANTPESSTYGDSIESEASAANQPIEAMTTELTETIAPDTDTEVNFTTIIDMPQAKTPEQAILNDVDELSTSQISQDLENVEQEQNAVFPPLDEIPEPIKVLDDIISEFEDASKPALLSFANGENHSEDDGYMSLSRKNLPKKDGEELSQNSVDSNIIPTVTTDSSTEKTNETLSIENSKAKDTVDGQQREAVKVAPETEIVQSTLPKARPTLAAISKNYSSLPCCGGRSGSGSTVGGIGSNRTRHGSCNGERNALGIDISAVHNAVLRGGLAKLPEPILNEHPVTIYPGPSSNARRAQRNTKSSVEKHKEVCHILNPLNAVTPSTSSSTSSSASSSSSNSSRKMERNTRESEKQKECRTLTSQLRKPHAVAWEIHFDIKSKNKSYTTSKLPTKRVTEKPTNSLDEKTFANHNRNSNEIVEPDSSDALNCCMYRNADMLGKGTFIIRRNHAKKPPYAADVFKSTTKSPPLDDNYHNIPIESQLHTENIECLVAPKVDMKLVDNRKSFELKPIPVFRQKSPSRDKLQLNIDATHNNYDLHEQDNVDLKQLQCLDEVCDVGETFYKAPNVLRKELSSESLNENSTSLEEEELEDETEESSDNMNKVPLSNYDDFHGYQPPTITTTAAGINGSLKGQEYAEMRTSNTTTPHTDLAPTLEEDEEQYSDFSYGGGTAVGGVGGGPAPPPPLKQIESNISALLRGDIAVARVGELQATPPLLQQQQQQPQPKRTIEFRPGIVHKSESAKEMLLSQNAFGPLPPSPPSSPDTFDYDALPPLPPSPTNLIAAAAAVNVGNVVELAKPQFIKTATTVEIHHSQPLPRTDERRSRERHTRHLNDELPLPLPLPTFDLPPAVPPHRSGTSMNTIKSRSIDSNYKRRKSPKVLSSYGTGNCNGSGITTPTGPPPIIPNYDGPYSTKRYISYGTKQRSLRQSPREEQRLQTSCSLPETPIFARGCDIPRTPFRRQNESQVSGSRTAPRSSTSHNINMGNSIVGIAGGNSFSASMCRQRSINHALASNEMLRLSGAPGRGWYPKQRTMRPASTENIDRLASARVWDSAAGMSGTGHTRKPLTLPPNLTPSFLNKSPREALRRVTSLLITKKKNTKDRRNKPYGDHAGEAGYHNYDEVNTSNTKQDTTTRTSKHSGGPTSSSSTSSGSQKPKEKKKGIFKSLWKRTKHVSLEQ